MIRVLRRLKEELLKEELKRPAPAAVEQPQRLKLRLGRAEILELRRQTGPPRKRRGHAMSRTNKRDLDDDRFEKATPHYQRAWQKQKRADELAISQQRKRQEEEEDEE
jgi:hypothetical protein